MDIEMLRESVQNFTDGRLLEIYRKERGDYHPDAFKIFEDELARRGIDPDVKVKADEQTEFAAACADAAAKNLSRDDFVPLDHPFLKADALIANTILHDSKIPYSIVKHDLTLTDTDDADDPILGSSSSSATADVFKTVFSIGSRSPATDLEVFNVMVYKDALTAARELINEHFEVDEECHGGFYVLRQSSFIDRLKTFNFNDVTMSDGAAQELLEVGLSVEERAAIVKLSASLMKEAESIEEERGIVVFFYDSLEGIMKKMKQESPSLTRTEFLAIIEMCQIYCEDELYDPALNSVAESILDFFLG